MKTIQGKVCWLFGVQETEFLERQEAAEFLKCNFQCCEGHKQNSIHFPCVVVKAETQNMEP